MNTAMESVQLNVRMNAALRDEGARILKSKGYTPATFVRCIWQKIVRRGEDLDGLIRFVEKDSADTAANSAATGDEKTLQSAKACNVCELWTEFTHNVDLTTEAIVNSYEELSHKEALELALSEDEDL